MAEVAVASTSTQPFRARFNAWFVTHEVAWELFITALAIVYVAIGFLADGLPVGSGGEVSRSSSG